jgi:hypothetical protein
MLVIFKYLTHIKIKIKNIPSIIRTIPFNTKLKEQISFEEVELSENEIINNNVQKINGKIYKIINLGYTNIIKISLKKKNFFHNIFEKS